MTSSSRYVIGDIHGCAKALRSLIQAIAPQADDEVIFLGDYVDRGPNSRDVIQQIIELQNRCRVFALRGNHEVMMQNVMNHSMDDSVWLRGGGQATVTSYGGSLDKVPGSHREFLDRLDRSLETDTEIFVHAMYDPQQNVEDQSDELTYWTHLPAVLPMPHVSGKRVFVGHTPQPGGVVLRQAHMVCMDTYCFGGGYLTAMNLADDSIVQVDRHGHVRRVPVEHLMRAVANCVRWLQKK